MATVFGIIVLLFTFSLNSSFAATTPASTSSKGVSNEPNVFQCLNKEMVKVQRDFTKALGTLSPTGFCGSKNMKHFADETSRAISHYQSCDDLSCYVGFFPTVKNQLVAIGIRCANNFVQNGPLVMTLNRIYDILDKCFIQPNV